MRAARSIASLLAAIALALSPVAALAAQGEPDPSFGAGGVSEPVPPGWDASLKALTLAPEGKIDAVGSYHPGDEWEVLALRVTEAGAPDPSFGSGGSEFEYFIPHVERTLADETGNTVVAEPDGSMIVGSTRVAGRLLASGARDTGFKLGQVMEYMGLAPFDGGSFVSAGYQENVEEKGFRQPVTGAFGPEGEPDTGFDGGGLFVIPVFSGNEWSGQAQIALPAEEGKTLIAGFASTFAQGSEVAWVARLEANGTLDPSFGSGGIYRTPIAGSVGVALARQPSGRIVLVGERATGEPNAFGEVSFETVAWGLDPSGRPDASFGAGGQTVIPPSPGNSDGAVAAAVDPAGRVLIAVQQSETSLRGGPALVARLTPSGDLDPTYGAGGEASAPAGSSVSALLVDSESRAIIAGGGIGAPFLERFTGEAGTAAPPPGTPPRSPTRHSTSPRPSGRKPVAVRWSCRRRPSQAKHRRCTLEVRVLLGGYGATRARLWRGRHPVALVRSRKRAGARVLSLSLNAPLGRTGYVLRLTLRHGRTAKRVALALVLNR